MTTNPWSAASVDHVLQLHALMLRIRIAEDAIANLVERGVVRCPCHLCVGQEAIPAGVCDVLTRGDYIFGGHRSHGHFLAKGGDLRQMMAEVLGKETGCARGRGGSMHLVAPEVGVLGIVPIVAATIPTAVGAALASSLRRDGHISVTFFGDGAVEEGTFHESMNLAAARNAPVVFVCENNLFASHLQILERRAKDNIIDSAAAHGMPGVSVDGNDVLAVRAAAAVAVERARSGGGPTLLECRTYRWRGHVGPSYDVDVGVKRKDELPYWRERDPLKKTREWLEVHGKTAGELERIAFEISAEVAAAVAFAEQSPFPAPESLADYIWADLS